MKLSADATDSERKDYCEEAKAEWTSQKAHDDEMKDLYLQKFNVPVTDPAQVAARAARDKDTNQDLEAVALGRGGQMVDQDSHLISVMWTHHVNAAGDSIPAVERATKLEKFCDGATLRMEELAPEPQMPKLRKDLILYHRAVLTVFPVPDAWADDRFLQREKEKDKDYELRRELELRRAFPIVWRCWSAPDCYFQWYGDGNYAVVRYRQMKAGEILEEYKYDEKTKVGAKRLSERYGQSGISAKENLTVVEYLDPEHYFLFNMDDQETLKNWDHGMGVNPAVLFTGPATPENDEIHWGGALLHARHVLKAHDEAISNIFTNLRRDTRALTVVYHDPKLEAPGPARGRPKKKTLKPGGQEDLWIGEKIERVGSAASNQDYGIALNESRRAIEDIALRRSHLQAMKSDVTGTATRLAGEFVQMEMSDYAGGIRTGGRKVAIRIFHAVRALEADVADIRSETTPEKVYVRYEGKEEETEEIAVTAAEVENYDDLVQVRWEFRTPSDQRSLFDMYRLMTEDRPGTGPFLDMRGARERVGIEDPERIDKAVTVQRIRNGPTILAEIEKDALERYRGWQEALRENVSPEEIMALERIGVPAELIIAALGQPPELPAGPDQGGSSLVPAENVMRTGEQLPVQAPRV